VTDTALAVAVLLAAVALTYMCCLRPLRRGRRCCSEERDAEEIRGLRREIASLRDEAAKGEVGKT